MRSSESRVPAGRMGRRFLLSLALCVPVLAQTGLVLRLYPIDDTARDPAFRSFVKKLRSAVRDRSTKALRKLVDDEVFVGPGDRDLGWTKFAATWRPDDRDSILWSTLADMLSLGFIREHPTLFLSPYLVWRFPEGLDRATHLVVIRDGASLRAAPSARSATTATLSFDVVEELAAPEPGEDLVPWVRVRTVDGRAGYLNTRDAMSPLVPHAQFGRHGGRWVLLALER